MRKGITVLGGLLCAGVLAPLAGAQNFLDENYGVEVVEDVVYGQAAVGLPTPGNVNLVADVYLPDGVELPRKRPALIVSHGLAWAYGDKAAVENFEILEAGGYVDSGGVYAREFAKRGYVCMSINFRRLSDDPAGSGLLSSVGADPFYFQNRINDKAPGATLAQRLAAVEAGVADLQTAVEWLRDNSNTYGVDINRIAIGGWSSGATNALLAAYAGGAPVAAVWSSSGGLGGSSGDFTSNDFLISGGGPPVILFHGDSDAYNSTTQSQVVNAALDLAGIPNAYYELAGEDHYYLHTAMTSGPPAKGGGQTVEDATAEFFHAQMDLASLEAENVIPVPVADSLGFVSLMAMLGATGALLLRRRNRAEAVRVRK